MLVELIRETGAQSVFFNHLYDPVSLVRDNGVKQGLQALGVACDTFNADLLYEPWEIYAEDGTPFTTFGPFWEKLEGMMYEPDLPALAPKALPPVPASIQSLSLEDLSLMSPEEAPSNEVLGRKWTPGEEAARGSLDDFLAERLRDYCGQRSLSDGQGTSQLSPHLHFGEVSVRRMWYQTKQMEWLWAQSGISSTSVAAFQRSMGFREYGRYLSFHFPFTHERALLEHLRAFPWRYNAADFKAWRQGATGFPLVDAGMRQLWATGWIHNRVRRVAAAFLVKHLLLPWQWGLKHYWDTLLDADLESAVLGWQFVSGGLPDGAPFHLLDNVEEESRRYDPSGHFVRRWVPQLARLPTEYIYAPWRAPQGVLDAAGVELGGNYPQPMVDPAHSQDRLTSALTSLKAATRSSPQGGRAAEVGGAQRQSPLPHLPGGEAAPGEQQQQAEGAPPNTADHGPAGEDRGQEGGSSSSGSASPRLGSHHRASRAQPPPGQAAPPPGEAPGHVSPAAAAAAAAGAPGSAGGGGAGRAVPGSSSGGAASDPVSGTLARLEAAAAATAAAHLAEANAAAAAAGKRKRPPKR